MIASKQTLLLACALGLAACTDGIVSPMRGSTKGPSLIREDTGATSALQTDELLTVTLDAQASTGYGWQVERIDGTMLRLAGQEHISASRYGGTDKQILRFAGVSKGKTDIKLSYRRPWEKGDMLRADGTTPSAPTFTATLDVTGPYTGSYRDPSAAPVTPRAEVSAGLGAGNLPASYTYCDATSCSPVKDQGTTNACWSFATTGVTEQLLKKAGAFHALSEQHLISCNTSNYDANQGGYQGFPWYDDTKDKKNQVGVVYASDYTFTGSNSACQSKPHHETISGWTEFAQSGPATTEQLKQAIYEHGAIWVGVCSDSSMQQYQSGVFNGSNCSQANHAVVLTGWDDVKGAFLLRNSWGSSWGQSGYMYIKYGVNSLGEKATYAGYGGSSPVTDGGAPACTPSCNGRACGDDGCGGNCGSCGNGQTCDNSGQCSSSNSTCTPDCSGKTCGFDGCGGFCGQCTSGQFCDPSGQCTSGGFCMPDCSGRTCGSDGCGGFCGLCPTGQFCDPSGQCSGGGATCTHPVCTAGAPLDGNCSSCATRVCAVDPYCCDVEWDRVCVGEAEMVCSQACF